MMGEAGAVAEAGNDEVAGAQPVAVGAPPFRDLRQALAADNTIFDESTANATIVASFGATPASKRRGGSSDDHDSGRKAAADGGGSGDSGDDDGDKRRGTLEAPSFSDLRRALGADNSAFDESTIIAASASVAYIAASVVGTPAVAAAAAAEEAASAPKFPASLSSPPQDESPSPPQPQQLLRSPSPPPPPFSPATAGSPSAGSPSSAGFSSPTLSDDSFDGLQADLVRLKLASDQARARLAGHPWTAPAAPAPAAAPK
jgi:hypothetical protein